MARTVEACHVFPFAVVTPSAFRVRAMALRHHRQGGATRQEHGSGSATDRQHRLLNFRALVLAALVRNHKLLSPVAHGWATVVTPLSGAMSHTHC